MFFSVHFILFLHLKGLHQNNRFDIALLLFNNRKK